VHPPGCDPCAHAVPGAGPAAAAAAPQATCPASWLPLHSHSPHAAAAGMTHPAEQSVSDMTAGAVSIIRGHDDSTTQDTQVGQAQLGRRASVQTDSTSPLDTPPPLPTLSMLLLASVVSRKGASHRLVMEHPGGGVLLPPASPPAAPLSAACF
jgi:hypothetical protein